MESSESDDMSEESNQSSEKTIENMNPNEFFDQKELCYYRKVNNFFKTCTSEQIEMMIDIIKSGSKNKDIPKSKISLRLLDWFVTKYPKKINLTIESESNDIEIFDVRMSYKAHLKSSKKRCFDPFRRRQKFLYRFPNTDYTVETTLCQLNFFKWLFSCDVLSYVEKNLKQINKEMINANKEEKEKKKNSEEHEESEKKPRRTKKTKDINIRASKIVDCDDVQIVLKFD
jgi:hypothetical protein